MNQAATVAKPGYLTPRYFVTVAAVTLVYLAAAKFGLSLAFATEQVTAFWPPTGIAVAAVLLFGYRLWPAIFLGAFVVNSTSNEPLLTAAGIAAGNTLGPLATVVLLRKFAGFDNAFARARDALSLCICGAIGMTLTASNGVANLALAGIVPWSAYGSVWWVWWVGDTMGVLVVAPLVLAWAARSRLDYTLKQVGEFSVLLAGLLGLCLIALTGTLFDGSLFVGQNYALLPSIIWTFVIWGALRFSPRETTTIVALIVGMAVWGAIHDRGPFVTGNLDERLILLELYMAAVVLTGLALSAVTTERRHAQVALQEAYDKLESRVDERARAESALRVKTLELEAANTALTREVRERERAELALRRGAAELQVLNTDLEEFAYVASHDLQEPLRKINTFAQMLQESAGDQLGADAVDYMTRMRTAAERMNSMIRDLLQISRSTDRGGQLGNVLLDVLLRRVLDDLESAMKESGAKITATPLPPVYGAAVQIEQVLRNLLANSLKYRNKNRPLEINISAGSVQNGFVEITVQDNGIGFEQKYAEQIFRPFNRLHGREHFPGTGIGLAICRKIVERHEGKIRADGRPDEGATFRLTLPVAREMK
jgi:signal transduction histidine kinase